MIQRHIQSQVNRLLQKFPIIALTGPRQSGKTTLCRLLKPDYRYVTLENPDSRQFARSDPRQFLEVYQNGVIIDEAQNVPELFSYLQGIVDERRRPGEYILTGSQNFLLLEKITQSLAGRVALFNLLPFSEHELAETPYAHSNWEDAVVKGFYPRLYDLDLEPADFFPNYLQTYVERDVRQLVNVSDLTLFQTFVRICAGRIGQLLNLAQLGNELGLDAKTVNRWLSVLEATFIVYRLPPYYRSFQKRLVKTPRLYFYDVGLAAWLLQIRRPDDLQVHFARGALFENFVITELIKNELNTGQRPQFYFWRDNIGNEVDLVWEGTAGKLNLLEIKAGRTINNEFFKGIQFLQKLEEPARLETSYVVYGGDEGQIRQQATVVPWNRLMTIRG